MKAYVIGNSFKNMIDRASALIGRSNYTIVLDCVYLEAKNNALFITTQRANMQKATLHMAASVVEEGSAFVYLSDLKKAYNMQNECVLETCEDLLTIANGKKKSTIRTLAFTEEEKVHVPDFEKKVEPVFNMSEKEFVHTILAMEPFIGGSSKPVVQSFHYDIKDDKMVVTDGYRLCTKVLHSENDSPDGKHLTDMTLPYIIAHDLKKVSSKTNGKIHVYANEKCAQFVGTDYLYTTKLVEGAYPNLNYTMDVAWEFEFSSDADDLIDISKSYASLLKKDKKIPMILSIKQDEIVSGIQVEDFRTSDKMNVTEADIPRETMTAFNPVFMLEGMKHLFAKGKVCAHGVYKDNSGSNIAPMLFENDEFKYLILPVRLSPDQIDNFSEYSL